MLLFFIAALSLAFGVLICISGNLTVLTWLWCLPLSFAGCFLALVILAVAFLWGSCQLIDTDKPRKEDSPFYRKLAGIYIDALIRVFRISIHTAGLDQVPRDSRFLLVCNHLHIADPAVLLNVFPRSQLAFISKQENQKLFVVGRIMHAMLCQPISRENNRQALRGIINCINIIKEDRASIAVFPEGYVSRDGKLQPFRNGAFKIALKTNVPIVVCTIQGTPDIFRNFFRFRRTDIQLHLVEVIPPEAFRGMTTTELGGRIHEKMLADLGQKYTPENG